MEYDDSLHSKNPPIYALERSRVHARQIMTCMELESSSWKGLATNCDTQSPGPTPFNPFRYGWQRTYRHEKWLVTCHAVLRVHWLILWCFPLDRWSIAFWILWVMAWRKQLFSSFESNSQLLSAEERHWNVIWFLVALKLIGMKFRSPV